jgi:hypothetical protein
MQAQTITGSGFVATFFALMNSAISGATFQMLVQSIIQGSNVVTFWTIDSFFMSKVMFFIPMFAQAIGSSRFVATFFTFVNFSIQGTSFQMFVQFAI